MAALNFKFARYCYPILESNRHYVVGWDEQLQILVGLLPLANVALIGAAAFAMRWLASLRKRRASDSPRPIAGFTFFSVHLVLLLGFVCWQMPSAYETYEGWCRPLLNRVDDGALRFIPEEGKPLEWFLCDSAVRFVFLSGPPIVVACAGAMFARRAARTSPGRRFAIMTLLASSGFAGVAFAVAMTPQPFREWQAVDLEFRIIDKVTGQPVKAAFVLVKDAFRDDRAPSRALTEAKGHVKLSRRYLCSGERNVFRAMGVFEPWRDWLEVSAPGYQTLRIPLTEAVGPIGDLERLRVNEVSLTHGKTPANSFRDIAGTYDRSYGRFKIEEDGRFAWREQRLFRPYVHGIWLRSAARRGVYFQGRSACWRVGSSSDGRSVPNHRVGRTPVPCFSGCPQSGAILPRSHVLSSQSCLARNVLGLSSRIGSRETPARRSATARKSLGAICSRRTHTPLPRDDRATGDGRSGDRIGDEFCATGCIRQTSRRTVHVNSSASVGNHSLTLGVPQFHSTPSVSEWVLRP